jgi:hypothetical protein
VSRLDSIQVCSFITSEAATRHAKKLAWVFDKSTTGVYLFSSLRKYTGSYQTGDNIQ